MLPHIVKFPNAERLTRAVNKIANERANQKSGQRARTMLGESDPELRAMGTEISQERKRRKATQQRREKKRMSCAGAQLRVRMPQHGSPRPNACWLLSIRDTCSRVGQGPPQFGIFYDLRNLIDGVIRHLLPSTLRSGAPLASERWDLPAVQLSLERLKRYQLAPCSLPAPCRL